MKGTAMRELTGRTVLLITLAAFGVIVGVNLLLAVMAVRTFPGLETPNSYVASQRFDRERAAQDALGWTAAPAYDGEVLTLLIQDRSGAPAPIRHLAVSIGRPTHKRDDRAVAMTFRGGLWTAPLALGPGLWNIHLEAEAPDGTLFRQRFDHVRQAGAGPVAEGRG